MLPALHSHLPAQGNRLQGLVDHDRDVIAGERLGDEIHRTQLHRLDRQLDRPEGGQHDDRWQ